MNIILKNINRKITSEIIKDRKIIISLFVDILYFLFFILMNFENFVFFYLKIKFITGKFYIDYILLIILFYHYEFLAFSITKYTV